MDSLEDRGILQRRGQKRRRLIPIFTYSADVSRGSETESTNQSSTHVGQDVTVQVGHNHHSVGVGSGVLDNLETDTVQKVLIVLNSREILGYLTARRQEHAVGHLPKRVV